MGASCCAFPSSDLGWILDSSLPDSQLVVPQKTILSRECGCRKPVVLGTTGFSMIFAMARGRALSVSASRYCSSAPVVLIRPWGGVGAWCANQTWTLGLSQMTTVLIKYRVVQLMCLQLLPRLAGPMFLASQFGMCAFHATCVGRRLPVSLSKQTQGGVLPGGTNTRRNLDMYWKGAPSFSLCSAFFKV